MHSVMWTSCVNTYVSKVEGNITRDSPPESTIYVVTFSGVTSGGMVTSGTMCWTCSRPTQITWGQKIKAAHMRDIGLLDE